MRPEIFVISDLHLVDDLRFDMCGPGGRSALVGFFEWVARRKMAGQDLHLVINGDIVDFLGSEEALAFTPSEKVIEARLKKNFSVNSDVWDALQKLVASGVRLTLLLGNHDLELSFPSVRRVLLDKLGGHGVDFIYDGEALRVDEHVLIEHGNRYDEWNVVPHGTLRAVRSRMSHGEELPEFPPLPGSRLVVEVMNDVKKDFSFVDLLKPEDEAVLPLLAVLKPAVAKKLVSIARLYRTAKKTAYDDLHLPLGLATASDRAPLGVASNLLGAAGGESAEPGLPMLALAQRLAREVLDDPRSLLTATSAIGEASYAAGAASFVKIWLRKGRPVVQLDLLAEALRGFAGKSPDPFAVDLGENPRYIVPATNAARNGFRLVIYGHTHLAKQIELYRTDQASPPAGERAMGRYINTGTWVDVMRIPRAVLDGDIIAARAALKVFVEDLLENRTSAWREHRPTFAWIRFGEDGMPDGKLYQYESPEPRALVETTASDRAGTLN